MRDSVQCTVLYGKAKTFAHRVFYLYLKLLKPFTRTSVPVGSVATLEEVLLVPYCIFNFCTRCILLFFGFFCQNIQQISNMLWAR